METPDKPITVMLVDDHALFRSGIRSLLQRHTDFSVVGEAADGVEGIKRAIQLQPAVDQAHDRCEDALAQLAQQQQALAAGEHQLGELQRYRQEYAEAGDGSQTVGALLNRQGFVERIDQAIVQQTRDLTRLERQLEQAREHWRQAHARESALSSVVQQQLERERQDEDRQEQSEVDERMQYRRPQR